MKLASRWIQFFIVLTALIGLASMPNSRPVLALDPPGPDRYTVITVDYTEYTWMVVTWNRNAVVCKIFIDYESPPSLLDIYNQCGQTIYNKWLRQPACYEVDKTKCVGYYTQMVSTAPKQKQISTKLPASSAWITLDGCEHIPSSSTNICEAPPRLLITGEEPLPNEHIIGIGGTVDGQDFSCDNSATCTIEITSTPKDGATLNFWAYSSYGDSSDVFTAQVRVAQSDQGDPDQQYWYVDVLSDQWRGDPVATCSDLWGSFPPVGGPPEWLTTPKASEELSSDIPYTYLAANLILQGAVDASDCPDGGVDPSGAANTCGLERARPAVTEWQNRFDDLILSTAKETGVPAHLLKNLFGRESQFWPGAVNNNDVGLGQLTQNGADTTLIWNQSFYDQFCPMMLKSDECGRGYLHLKEKDRLLLRNALINSVDGRCEECPLGIDLSRAAYSVNVFANTLLANCKQTGQILHNITGDTPGNVASYEDLWKYTLVNYNAGPGCLGDALQSTSDQGHDLAWDNVIAFFPPACTGAITYVNDISR